MSSANTVSPSPAVSFSRCPTYDPACVDVAIGEALATLGGIGAFVTPGQRILVKPNLLSDHVPEDAVTTHPEIVRAVIRRVKSAGGIPVVGDSSASAMNTARVWERTGMKAVCCEEGVELVVFEGEGGRTVTRDGITFTLSHILDKVDGVINVCKVKAHILMTLTAGVKNLYGFLPGYQKATLHKEFPNPSDFGRLLCALAREVRPVLTIADGVVGMEGEGPSGGTPVHLGFVAASSDPFELDCALCDVLGIPRKSVPYLRDYKALNSPPAEGCPPYLNSPPAEGWRGSAGVVQNSSFFIPNSSFNSPPLRFRVPSTFKTRLIPRRLVKCFAFLVWIRPAFDAATCVRCGKCAKACPMRVLELAPPNSDSNAQTGMSAPHWKTPRLVSPSRCIGCCCCHEVCPVKAIAMRRSPLLRLVGV